MKKIEFIYLSQEDILDMNIGLMEIIDLVETGLKEHGRGRVENPPKPGIHSKSNSFIHAMPAYYKDLNIGGLKWVSGYPDNRDLGLPQILGLLILNDMNTGIPLCVMDCRWITAVRTAAVTGITAKYCAKRNASTLGIIGTGVQGKYNLLALKEVIRSIERVKIFDIRREAAENYRDELSKKSGVQITIGENVESVSRGSDILLTATQKLEKPLIKNEWFEKGCLGIGLEGSRAWSGEAILRADKFITDDWEQTKYYQTQGSFADGLPSRYTEIGKIICGLKPGRENDDERILAISPGLAIEDMIVANHLYQVAKGKNIYRRLPLMEKEI
ncbi:MAG TPA: ornithine cyclodeaminase family protein [Thermodesulfobacteriota bacterium]|nr:ornithine cyclodeaminase family protein [Thermodesulfobacteriota bacterium]